MGEALAAAHLAVQLLLPQRRLLYPGDATWTEQGFRLAWHVMLVEKSGDVSFRVVESSTGRRWTVHRGVLTPMQARTMSTVPDMIAQAATMVRDDFARRGHPSVAVYADAFVSINGRPSRRIVDPSVDLGRVGDSLGPKPWILP
ncbi:MAG: HTTM domain-containing protein [Polyangiales bacterium]